MVLDRAISSIQTRRGGTPNGSFLASGRSPSGSSYIQIDWTKRLSVLDHYSGSILRRVIVTDFIQVSVANLESSIQPTSCVATSDLARALVEGSASVAVSAWLPKPSSAVRLPWQPISSKRHFDTACFTSPASGISSLLLPTFFRSRRLKPLAQQRPSSQSSI